jgi:uncharacterized membrane protein YjdF
MHFTRAHWILIGINALYLVPLIVKFTLEGNWEFVVYIGQVVGLIMLLLLTLHKTKFPVWLLIMLSAWAGLHMAGGAIYVNDVTLYSYKFFHVVTLGDGDGYILKYDQIVHFFGFFVATFVAYWLLLPQLKQNFRIGVIAFIAFLAGMGFGAINEMIEFAVVIYAPETGVGGYWNTSIDLVANALGALTAALIITFKGIGAETPSGSHFPTHYATKPRA